MKGVVILLFCFKWCSSFNLDASFPQAFSSEDSGSHFGYKVALHNNSGDYSILVSAIKGIGTKSNRPGRILKCRIPGTSCESFLSPDDQTPAVGEKQILDNMALGMALAVNNDGVTVACAPLWKVDRVGLYTPNGLCYILRKDLTVQSYEAPFTTQRKQTLRLIYYFGMAEFGMSASFTEEQSVPNRTHLFVGSPGLVDWSGSFVHYDVVNGEVDKTYEYVKPPDRAQVIQYVGYSLASGRFFNKDEVYVATGSPRDNDLKGSVLIFSQKTLSSTLESYQIKKTGLQMGEYFGASVLAVDVNNDQLSDLLIGAPQYSQSPRGDEGRVFFYLSSGVHLLDSGTIMGDLVPGARFGAALASIGDINQDGFNDVAIGAPFENVNGAVYIFNGNSQGLSFRYSQKIEGRSIRSPAGVIPIGFGISISQGLDVDGNGYPDIAVGAFIKNQVFLFKSSPVVSVEASLDFSAALIDPKTVTCNYKGQQKFCFDVTIRLKYSGAKVPDSVEFDIMLQMDVLKRAFSRGFLADERDEKRSSISETLTVTKGSLTPKSYKVYIEKDVHDIVTPMQFRLDYNLTRPRSLACNPPCPVLSRSSATSAVNKISFRNQCGNDICKSDLNVKAFILGHKENEPLYAKKGEPFTLRIQVKNNGRDPAYVAEVDVILSQDLKIVNRATCLDTTTGLANTTLLCDVANPLSKGEEKTIDLKIDLKRETTKVRMEVVARTRSEDNNADKKRVVIDLEYVNRADVSILGLSSLDRITFNDNTTEVSLTHTYLISKLYESPIEKAEATIFLPAAFSKTGHAIASVSTIQADDKTSVPGVCNSTVVIAYEEFKETKSAGFSFWKGGELPVIPYLAVKCDNKAIRCRKITCQFGPFYDATTTGKVSINLKINMTSIGHEEGIPEVLELTSVGTVKITDNINREKPPQPGIKEAKILTTFYKDGPPAPKTVAIWVYIVSVLGGLVVISLIILLCFKLGFFKRLKRDRMLRSAALVDKNERDEREIVEEIVESERDSMMQRQDEGNSRNT